MKEHFETIDGKEYKVTTLPSDPRLQPARTRKRALWNSLTAKEKKQYLAGKRAEARKKRKRRRRKKPNA